jgi:sugar lactone lactonase YvrE
MDEASGSQKDVAANSCAGKTDDSILHFDASGKLVKSFGSGIFLFPHGICVDRDGNIWVTDGQAKDGKGFQVFKFSPDGRVLMTLGRCRHCSERGHFYL